MWRNPPCETCGRSTEGAKRYRVFAAIAECKRCSLARAYRYAELCEPDPTGNVVVDRRAKRAFVRKVAAVLFGEVA